MKAGDFLKQKKIGQTFVATKDKNGYIELTELLEDFLKVQGNKSTEMFPDTEADGYVFCGKCGKMK